MTGKIYSFLYSNLPAGQNVKKVRNGLLMGLFISSGWAIFSFLHRFILATNALYYYDEAGKKHLDVSAWESYPHGLECMENSFILFYVFFICLLGFAVYNYIYHYIGSKSIYTMLRIGKKELIKRCVCVPFLTVLLSLLSMAADTLLCAVIYILFVPEIHP